MGEVQGYVTRSLGAPLSGLQGVSAGRRPIGLGDQFMASRVDGTMIASFGNIREAQRAVEATAGGGLLKWFRENDERTAIERYRGELLSFWPGDLGELIEGGAFWRADLGLRLVPAAVPPSTDQLITRWAARPASSRVATAATLAASPLYADAETILTTTGRPAARFFGGDAMSTTLTAIAPPYSIYCCVTYNEAAPARRELIFESTGGGIFRIGVTAAGDWHVETDAGTMVGPTAVDGETAVIHVEQSTTGITAYLNGVAFGSQPNVPGALSFAISSVTTADDWDGDIFEILFLRFVTNVAMRTMLLNYYFSYYGITP